MTKEKSTRLHDSISIVKNVANPRRSAPLKEEFIFGDIFMKKPVKKK